MSSLKGRLVSKAPLFALGAGLVLIPALYGAGVLSIETVNQLGRFLCFAIVAIGIDLVWGYTGILTLCQAMFFTLGGYAMGMHLALHGPLDGDGIPRCLFVVTSDVSGFKLPEFWEPFRTLPGALLLAVLIPGLAAFIFGFFAFRSRVKGVYFSIITQATTLGVCLLFRRNEMRLCGTNGLTNFVKLGGFDLQSSDVKLGLYVLTVLVLAALYVLCKVMVNSRFGRILAAIRDNEGRLRALGYKPLYYKLAVFTLAAAIAGIGGMLYTPQTGIITPFNMEPDKSIFLVVLVAVGGRCTLSGAVIGSIVVNYVYSLLTSGTIYNKIFSPANGGDASQVQKLFELLLGPKGWPFVLGALFLGVVMFMPDGLIGIWRKFIAEDAEVKSTPTPTPTGAASAPHDADPKQPHAPPTATLLSASPTAPGGNA